MPLIVQKFGGTSVGTPERIRLVADRIAQSYQSGNQLVVVVSAMGHTTDELIDLAQKVSDQPPHREMDMLLSAGERISMALLSMALADRKVPAISLTGSQTGIITDQSHRRARIQRILGGRVRTALAENNVVIVAGFQGVSETKEITTLGRGGSDTTAVALAAALNASLCEILTDVDGVYSADPRIVPHAKLWKTLPHDLMVELATRGAGVLHPRSIELAKQFKVPLQVKHSLKPGNEGTHVIDRNQVEKGQMEEFGIVGVTADSDKVHLTVSLSQSSAVSQVWERAARAHLSVVVPLFMENEVRFFSDRDGIRDWEKHLDEMKKSGLVKSYSIDSETVPLSVVGDRFSQDGLAFQRVLEVLSQAGISVSTGSSSALAMTVGISRNRAKDGVEVLHRELVK